MLFSNVSAIEVLSVAQQEKSMDVFVGGCVRRWKSGFRHCFICLGDFKNAFIYIVGDIMLAVSVF